MDNFITDFLVATAFAQQVGSGATAGSVPGAAKIATFTSFDLVKILVVPVGLWFIKGILVYSIERVQS